MKWCKDSSQQPRLNYVCITTLDAKLLKLKLGGERLWTSFSFPRFSFGFRFGPWRNGNVNVLLGLQLVRLIKCLVVTWWLPSPEQSEWFKLVTSQASHFSIKLVNMLYFVFYIPSKPNHFSTDIKSQSGCNFISKFEKSSVLKLFAAPHWTKV